MPPRELHKMAFYHPVGFSLWNISDERVADLKNVFPDIHFVNTDNLETLVAELTDADALCSMRMTPELFRAAKKLKWIHSVAAGVGGLMIPEVLASDVLITNARGIFSVIMAEHTVGLMLACSRRLFDSYRFQRAHVWSREQLWAMPPPMGEVQGKTLGIIGLGSIGQEISKRARAFGMRVLGVKKDLASGAEHADRVYSLPQLNEVLQESDFVVLTLPHTPETKRLMSDAPLGAMKPSAYLINVGRGKLVDEEALLRALNEQRLAGAALDVFETEPLPPNSPLWDHPKIFITPHSSACFPEFWQRSRDLIIENIRRFRSGAPLKNSVDKQKGY